MTTMTTTDDAITREVLAAIRQALITPDAFHQLAERYERSVHAALAQGDNPELPPDSDR
jgi:hypothetical protein